ncbi:MAG TPA: uroporphyrinogen decarboxylase family protein [Spirochaetia bacterium]|nr:uroporphyrinogen decarboxylase family protein [Spirochaetia bacterium]
MTKGNEKLYQERLNRYTTAMDLGKPDKVPIRLSLSEFMAKYAGFQLQEIYYDLEKNIAATNKVLSDLDVDAISGAPSLWWASLHDAVGARYLKYAGRELEANSQFQYVEDEYMLAEDYDAFTADPTRWIMEVYLPRIHKDLAAPGSYRAGVALLKSAAAMATANARMQRARASWAEDYGMPMSIAGFAKAPFDTLADTLRGLKGIMMDLRRRPEKVLAALEVVVPHNVFYALATSGGNTLLPAFMPLHRGSFPFLNPDYWQRFYWPSLKQVIEELWARGKRTLFYAEGNWTPYLAAIAELPPKSIVFHVDVTDMAKAKEVLGGRFCLSGNVPNTLMAYGRPEDVREYCKRLIDEYAGDGGFIIDTGGVMQADVKLENVVALIETARNM